MKMLIFAIASVIALLGTASFAHGQEATERYIPIGQSPGLSKKYTYIGTIEAVAPEKRTITAGGRTVKITDRTRIWLDRSKQKLGNTSGAIRDLQQGRRVEIKYDNAAQPQAADWIKIEVASP